MQLARLPHDPRALLDFYEEALTRLGAVVDRPWHDRLGLLAEGAAARLWNDDGTLHETELHVLSAEATGERDASRDVFPGCPLSFRLAEQLDATLPPMGRVALAPEPGADRLPAAEVLERLWRQQHPATQRWRLLDAPKPGAHASLVALVRCEIQAIDQHWSLHRLAIALPGGEPDDGLTQRLPFCTAAEGEPADIEWPALDPPTCLRWLAAALERELAATLTGIAARQRAHLRREFERIDAYFAGYETELAARRTRSAEAAARIEQRLQASRAERDRRRADQLARHAVHVVPRLHACLLVAEPAWIASLEVVEDRHTARHTARFVPRSRRWYVLTTAA